MAFESDLLNKNFVRNLNNPVIFFLWKQEQLLFSFPNVLLYPSFRSPLTFLLFFFFFFVTTYLSNKLRIFFMEFFLVDLKVLMICNLVIDDCRCWFFFSLLQPGTQELFLATRILQRMKSVLSLQYQLTLGEGKLQATSFLRQKKLL